MTKKTDISRIKKGDTILLTAEVVDVNPRMILVLPLSFLAEPQWILPEGVHSHIPAPVNWKAGDKFIFSGGSGKWTILFIDEKSVYLEYDIDQARREYTRQEFNIWKKDLVT